MKVVTLATHDSGYLQALKESCDRYGYDLKVLGWGEKWEGFVMRANLYKEYLKEIPPDEYVVCCDAYDVLALRPAEELLQEIKGSDKVICAFDEHSSITDFIYGKPPYEFDGKKYYANAGMLIGKCEKIIQIYEIMCKDEKCTKKNIEDQALFNGLLQVHNELVVIDVNNELIYNLKYPRDKSYLKQMIDGAIFNKRFVLDDTHDFFNINDGSLKNGNRPFFIHANGNSDIDSLCEKMGYSKGIYNDAFNSYNGLKTFKIMLLRKLIILSHYIFGIFSICTPSTFLIFNLKPPMLFLLSMILMYASIITQWYILGDCFLTSYENIYNYKEENHWYNNTWFISQSFTKWLFTYSPLINVFILCFLIYRRI